MPEWLIILLALALVGLIVRREWRAHIDLPGSSAPRLPRGSGSDEASGHGRAGEFHTDDDDWADQLHAINLSVNRKMWSYYQERMVPIAEVTHYEVEALIRTLAVPEWVPDRYRMAA